MNKNGLHIFISIIDLKKNWFILNKLNPIFENKYSDDVIEHTKPDKNEI